jgi:hypothetical protein
MIPLKRDHLIQQREIVIHKTKNQELKLLQKCNKNEILSLIKKPNKFRTVKQIVKLN